MKCFGVLGPDVETGRTSLAELAHCDLRGTPVPTGVISIPPPRFDSSADHRRRAVLMRVHSFSCNFRDRPKIMLAAKRQGGRTFTPMGTDFTAEVIEVGRDVRSLRPGDRVIPDGCWPERRDELGSPSKPGLPTEQASMEFQIFAENQVVKVPASMGRIDAAAFTVGAQTSYSFIRRSQVAAGDHVMVTGGRSNTALFLTRILVASGVEVTVLTTSAQHVERIREQGPSAVICVAGGADWHRAPEVAARHRAVGGFHAVLDPFMDLHLNGALHLLRPFGRYLSCGEAGKSQNSRDSSPPWLTIRALETLRIFNLSIIGNCLGNREDLLRAVEDHSAGKWRVPLDSTFTDNRDGRFLRRTYADPERFGKVVYTLNP